MKTRIVKRSNCLSPTALGAGSGGRGYLRGGGLLAVAASALLLGPLLGHASETDENLEATVRGAYVFRTLLAEEGIAMEVSNGMVTLRGSVGIPLQRELAEEAVAALPGVKGIDNQILVKPAAPEAADALLALKVKTILGLHRSGRTHAARLEVMGGAVVLKGEVEDEAQRVLAAESAAAKANNGRGPGAAEAVGEVDDPSVAAQVRMALRAHRSTGSLKPGVESKEGVVTLTGHVGSAAERDHVSRLCGDIHGVRKVENKMTPEPESTEN